MWRLQAKYETVCARCRGYIKKGAWIVEERDHWCHAVCPDELRKRHQEIAERKGPLTYTEYVTDETTGETVAVEREL